MPRQYQGLLISRPLLQSAQEEEAPPPSSPLSDLWRAPNDPLPPNEQLLYVASQCDAKKMKALLQQDLANPDAVVCKTVGPCAFTVGSTFQGWSALAIATRRSARNGGADELHALPTPLYTW